MSTISKPLSGMLYTGANLVLASAPFKNNLNAVYGYNPEGTGYTVFKPTSNFNSLRELVQDGSYIVDAKSLGFELPGATLAATRDQVGVYGIGKLALTSPAVGTLRVAIQVDAAGGPGSRISATGTSWLYGWISGDTEIEVLSAQAQPHNVEVVYEKTGLPSGATQFFLQLTANGEETNMNYSTDVTIL
ncbi:hypothetical protein [Hymenobacter sp. 5414T-23]|uniref:hypothetical protein n=1 Tax=Hymenobacter sp. 5414T-23 TaxID=2932252 RepID=UPI001FD091CA|nr:hypothetical protein [Hymenobacter sp. 5414T-23]UOQ81014.1 hypothetical protein MUN83_19740 [Hymenobacter sp. 5414T-23]